MRLFLAELCSHNIFAEYLLLYLPHKIEWAIIIVTMHVDDQLFQRNGKTYQRVLLRTSYRDKGKVKKQTVGNLSSCSREEIDAIRMALKYKHELSRLQAIVDSPVKMRKGLSVGAVFVLQAIADRLGIKKALGRSVEGRLALWQIIARIIDQGSRLSSVRLAGRHAGCDVLGLDAFDEDDLYANLDWLAERQAVIENRLFQAEGKDRVLPPLFLYDVTSSYFEGQQNELSEYGYDRDGKKGKKQIVVGLLTDAEGDPVSVQVFPGNTADVKTFADQVKKVRERFGVRGVTMVGDRGMIKSQQIEQLPEGFYYVTAVTKPQIELLLRQGVLQMTLFDEDVCEVEKEGTRYILRRNPVRADEMAAQREDKERCVQEAVDRQNVYLREHPRAQVSVALRKVCEKVERLKGNRWLAVEAKDRTLVLRRDEEKLEELSRLDGCYVIKTDVPSRDASAQVIHDRYKSLAEVERAFRTMKTVHLETRPHFLRKAPRTRGHVFVVMLAYKIIRYLKEAWRAVNLTVEEGIAELATICSTELIVGGVCHAQTVPEPDSPGKELLKALRLTLPDAIPRKGIKVDTKRKLAPRK